MALSTLKSTQNPGPGAEGGSSGSTPWALIFGLWSLPALLSASQAYVRQSGEINWAWALLLQLPAWWIWALFTPIVLRLAVRYPVGAGAWARPVARHWGIGTLFVLAYIILQAPFGIWREGRSVTLDAYVSALGGGLLFQYLSQLLIYFGILGIGHAVLYQRRLAWSERQAVVLEAELGAARLQALRTQLQPHFLFNTLHTVGGFVRTDQKAEAIETLSGLSGLLRFTLDNLDRSRVPLHWEIEALERYLAIEEIRFQDRLSVSRSVDPAAANVLVPALILQPLVENAIKHGFGPGTDSLSIELEARVDEDRLIIELTDDGQGVSADFDLDAATGVGLRLTRSRLESLHPGEHTFRIDRLEPRGARVHLQVPAEADETP